MSLETTFSAICLATALYYTHTYIQFPSLKLNRSTPQWSLVLTVTVRIWASLHVLYELHALLCGHNSYLPPPLSSFCNTSVSVPPRSLSIQAFSGAGMIIAGGVLRALSHRTLGSNYVFDLKVTRSHTLVTTGPYSVVRHPMYTGLVSVTSGWVVLMMSSDTSFQSCLGSSYPVATKFDIGIVAFFAAWKSLYVLWRARAEDKMLQMHFREDWDEWASITRSRVIPYIY